MEPEKEQKPLEAEEAKTDLPAQAGEVPAKGGKQEKESPGGLHTYESDLAGAVKTKRGATVKKVLEEEKQKEQERQALKKTAKKNLILGMFSVFFVIVGIILIIVFFFAKKEPVIIQPAPDLIVFADKFELINITEMDKAKIENTISGQTSSLSKASKDIVTYFIIETTDAGDTLVPIKTILSKLETQAPRALMGGIQENFMIGAYANTSGNNLFLIFQTSPLTDTFTKMLEWEDHLFDDMYKLFGVSVSGSNKDLFAKRFEDILVQNRSIRGIRDANGQPVFMYELLNDSTVVITTDVETLGEIVERFRVSKITL